MYAPKPSVPPLCQTMAPFGVWLDHPAERVGALSLIATFACAYGEVFGRDNPPSLEGAVAKLQADPARHVLNGGIHVAGAVEAVGESGVNGTSIVPSGVQRWPSA